MSIATALTALADDVSAAKAAITAKGGTAPNGTADMADAIAAIPSGGITPTGNINITDTNVTDVTNYATAQISSDTLLAENIKKDVNILGVVGSFEGGGGGIVEYEVTPTSNLGELQFPIPNNPANTDFFFAFTSDISPETLDWTYGAVANGIRIESTPYNIKMSKMSIIHNGASDTTWTTSITRNTDSITLKGGGGAVRFNAGTTYKAVYHEWGA